MRIALAQVRLTCREGDRGSLQVKSTFDKTEKMEHRTDESISFTDDDLVIIKNCRESACEITLETIRLSSDKRIVGRPSRQPAFTLVPKEVSEIRFRQAVKLGGGESLALTTSQFITNRKRGNYSGAV